MPNANDRESPSSSVRAPRMIYGTAWKEERTEDLTTLALLEGFRAVDTANQRKHYHEEAVGNAIRRAAEAAPGVTREQLFLQTKFTFVSGQDHRLPYDVKAPIHVQVAQSFDSSLKHLHTDFIDAYLLHGPSSHSGLTAADWEAWRAMELLVQSGRARTIGVSNVSRAQLAALCQDAVVAPSFVQNRCYASHGWDREVRSLCHARGIVYQGFSLLTANQRELATAPVLDIAHHRKNSVPELVFAFCAQIGIVPLTGTAQAAHRRLDLEALELELTPAELDVFERLDQR